ncbi:MAG: hypothetical protein SCARUB_01271 [Candidatus Scalindua rubra]|uniref:Colicin V production protein n=1 Tax=Candidatus Scalindua rubra TaxID=1872076 RepID=A0A1E3XDD1_9BACT|nr:MAG: hypothetical protein SCARUB_01271 [Candidatus Scalindua rubra]
MNWLDLTLIAVMAIGTIFGIMTGPLWQIYRILSVALSVAAAFLLHKLLSNILYGISSAKVSNILGYAITFGVILIITYAIGNLFRAFLTKRKFGISGRIIGGGISFIKTALTCCIIISGVSFLGNNQTGKTISNSLIAHNLDKGSKVVISKFPQNVKGVSIVEKKVNVKKVKSITKGE